MTAFDRIEPRITELMDELAPAQVPDYFDDLLRQTVRTRQRPAWLSIERWLPVGVIVRTDPIRRGPWRPIAIAALLVAAATALVLIAGTGRRPPPSPFGPTSRAQVGAPVAPRWFAADGQSLWVHEPTSLVRVDLATSAITGKVPMNSMDYGYETTGAGSVWQTDYDHDVLLRIDPVAGKVVASIPVGSAPEGVAVTAGVGVGRRRARWGGHARRSRDQPCRRDDPGRSDRSRRATDHDGWTRWRLGGRPEHG